THHQPSQHVHCHLSCCHRLTRSPPPIAPLCPYTTLFRSETDGYHHDTKFIENRDKFVSTLAKTDPNSFLYMFRHAFGQPQSAGRSEEHTSELQSRENLVCRLLLEKKNVTKYMQQRVCDVA